MTVRIRRYSDSDLAAVADVHAEVFTRQLDSKAWITCNARAYPRMRLYVAEFQGGVWGFVLWTEKSGFRQDVYRKRDRRAARRSVSAGGREATCRALRDDHRKTLGAEIEARVPSLYSADEVLMVARNPLPR
jgi:hypothetical protein